MKRTYLLVMLVAAILATSASVSAQERRPIALNDAIDLAVRNSKVLRNSKAKTAEAEALLQQARNGQLPDLKISGSYLRVTQPNIDLDPAVSKALSGGSSSSGGQGGSGSSGSSGGSGSTGSETNLNNLKINQVMYGMANASMPLFSGFRVRYGIESAKFLLLAARLDADNDRESVILNSVNAYANLYKAQENVRLLTEELAQSSKRDSDFAGMEKNGLLARNDMLKAQLQTTNIAYSLADAESNAKVAEVNMNLLLGLPENTGLLPDSNSFMAQRAIETIEVYEKTALEHRSDAAAGKYRTRAAGVAVNTAKADYYPTVALSGGYVAAKIPNLFTVTNAVTYGVAVQYDLGSFWKTGAKVAQQKAREEQASANEALLDDQIRLQINQSYADFLTAQKKIGVSNQAVEQGNENYRITSNKYKNGLVTTTDLLEADVSLLQARINLALAKVDAMVAYDTILERSGLLTDPIRATSKR